MGAGWWWEGCGGQAGPCRNSGAAGVAGRPGRGGVAVPLPSEVRLAISANDGSLDSEVDPRFGRARFFIITDGNGSLVEVIDNRGSDDLPHGAGTAAVEAVVRRGVKTVLTGQVGPRAEEGLRAAGIDVRLGCSGQCREVLTAYLFGARD